VEGIQTMGIILFILTAICSNCSSSSLVDHRKSLQGTTPQLGKIDEELLPYIKEFQREYPFSLSRIRAEIQDLPDNYAGFCNNFLVGENQLSKGLIRIDKEYFEENNERYGIPNLPNKALIYHELGHCILDLDHDESEIHPGVPASLMNPSTIRESILREWEDHYFKELFMEVR